MHGSHNKSNQTSKEERQAGALFTNAGTPTSPRVSEHETRRPARRENSSTSSSPMPPARPALPHTAPAAPRIHVGVSIRSQRSRFTFQSLRFAMVDRLPWRDGPRQPG